MANNNNSFQDQVARFPIGLQPAYQIPDMDLMYSDEEDRLIEFKRSFDKKAEDAAHD